MSNNNLKIHFITHTNDPDPLLSKSNSIGVLNTNYKLETIFQKENFDEYDLYIIHPDDSYDQGYSFCQKPLILYSDEYDKLEWLKNDIVRISKSTLKMKVLKYTPCSKIIIKNVYQ
jgi:hypothetical protein